MQAIINPKYIHLHYFINSIPSQFDNPDFGITLHDGRNTIKRVEVNGVQLAIKSYRRISIVNRLAYGSIRKSKSHRAYNHAMRLNYLGIDSPEAVAAIDTRRNGRIVSSYFVSLYSDYSSMAVVNDYPRNASTLEPLMDAMVDYLVRLHDVGILHRDLNITNILYSPDHIIAYKFQLIDTNRMSFKSKLSLRQRVENLRRLSCGTTAYAYILEHYAKRMQLANDEFQLKGLLARLLFDKLQRIRQRAKQKIKQRFLTTK